MGQGEVLRRLARPIAREREERGLHQRRLALEERLAEVEASDSPEKVRGCHLVPMRLSPRRPLLSPG